MKRIVLIVIFCGISCLSHASVPTAAADKKEAAENTGTTIEDSWPTPVVVLSIGTETQYSTPEKYPATPQFTPHSQHGNFDFQARSSDFGIKRPMAPVAGSSSNNGSPVSFNGPIVPAALVISAGNETESSAASQHSTAPIKKHKRASSAPLSSALHAMIIEKAPVLAAVAAHAKSADEKPQHKTNG